MRAAKEVRVVVSSQPKRSQNEPARAVSLKRRRGPLGLPGEGDEALRDAPLAVDDRRAQSEYSDPMSATSPRRYLLPAPR